MKKVTLFSVAWFNAIFCFCQPLEITTTGNWSNSSIWLNGEIADQSSEDATMQSNKTVTIQTGESFTIGDFTADNLNGLIIDAGGSLSLSPGSFLAAGNGTTITVNGTFTVNGNFTVQNNVTLVINGSMTVTGYVDMGTNGNLTVSGALTVGGNFTGENNTIVTVNASGSVHVGGSVSVGNGSDLLGDGSFYSSVMPCTGPAEFCGTVLPIELISFSATLADDVVTLRWATASERNVDGYHVEKSIDGIFFKELAFVKSQGNSLLRQDYELNDQNPFVGNTYYRLRETDLDGYTQTFDIIAVRFDGEQTVTIFPNPTASDQITFALNFVPEGSLEFQITDSRGRNLKRSFFENYPTTIDHGLQPGVYFLSVKGIHWKKVVRFVIK
jgi:hypothetical protein